ncbi:MAG: peroxiredoxin [Bacteroidota bacterium]
MKIVRSTLLLLFFTSFLFAQNSKGEGVLIHISSGLDNPHKVLMGLTIALKFSENKDVFVFMDINAPEVVLTNSKSLEFNKFEPSKILVTKLLERGVTIAVCPMCLEAMNKSQFDLMKGIKIVNKDDLFDFTTGRIISLSY